MKNTKTYWFPIFRKVVPADFESWMETLAADGWNVDKVGTTDSIKMTFRKTEPKKYRYVFDLNPFHNTINRDYMRTYEQFGWEFVGQMSSCYVWRTEYADTRPESFTDTDSVIRRNKRFRNAITAALVIFIIAVMAGIAGIVICAATGRTEKIFKLVPYILFMSAFCYYFCWVIGKINGNIDK